ncbi:MAG: DUF2267 domain-containing protein, partial [Bdellovibrionales bacterium]
KSGHQRCVGIIALDDLLAADAIDSHSLKRILKSQISRRFSRSTQKSDESSASQEFIRQLAHQLDLTESRSKEVCNFVLGAVAQRLNYSAAVQFILQLPYVLQADLLSLPAGPDRSITGQRISDGVADLLEIPIEGVQVNLQKIWALLTKFADKKQMDHVVSQLPNDVAGLLLHPASVIRHDFEEWAGP